MSDDDRDKPAEDEAGIWREAADRLKISTTAEGPNRTDGLAALRFVWGDQWDGDVKNERQIEGRPALTVNHTAVFVNRLKNTLRQQRPRIKCHPVGNGANVDTANTVNGLIRHIETLSDASVAYDRGAACAVAIGWGYWRIVSEYIDERSFDQELKILPIRNAFTVYDDPASEHPAGLDRGWLIISTKMKRDEYKRRHPGVSNAEWSYAEAPGDGTLEWESKEEIRLAEYFRICEYKDELCQMTDGSLRLRSELKKIDGDVREAVQYEVAKDKRTGKEITRPTTRRHVQWFLLNGKQIVERKDLPGKYIPVIRCEGQVEDVDGRVYRKGMVADLMDPARIYNYTETQKTERYALTPKAPWVAYEGVIDGHPEWNDANQKSYSVLVGKAVLGPDGQTMLPLPARTPPPPVEAGMAEWSSSAERNLMAVAGMAPDNPEITRRVVSGDKHLQRRQGMQDLTHFQYYDNQTLSIAATGIILLDLFPYYYDTKRMQRIIGDDGTPELVMLNDEQVSDGVKTVKNDMQVGRYDIVMDTGPGYATQQEENAENMVNLLGTPLGEVIVKTGADLVLRNFNFPGAQDLADRAMVTNPEAMDKAVKNLPKQAQTIIGAMSAAMKQKDEQIKNLSLELKYKATIEGAKVEERKEANVRDNETKLQIAGAGNVVKLHAEDTKAATARDVAEIHGATQLLNTQVESEHEERAADKLIEAGTTDRKPNGE